jgi:hypothetical protein
MKIRYILRRLLQSPVFTLIVVATLAIGIGANTAIFSVIDGVLLKPLPYAHPQSLISVSQRAPGLGIEDTDMSAFLYFTYREQNKTFEEIG